MAENNKIIRIALIGPESTGKTTLAKELASHYNTVCVSEYARQYCQMLTRPYTIDDIEYIARKQLLIENDLLNKANKYIFSDTELIISKVWAEDVFNTVPDWIAENIKQTQYNLYLLTYPDIDWVKDDVRENGGRRDYFFERYKAELDAINGRYVIVKGKGQTRLKSAVKAIDVFFN